MSDIFGDDNKPKTDDFGAMLEASFGQLQVKFEKGDKVTAEVISIGKDDVFVSAKGKDGVVPKAELLKDGQLEIKVGDNIDLYVIKTQDSLVHLTAKASSKALAETLEDAFDFETPVEGRVTEVVNGGFRVSVHGKLAFCPMSQIDNKPVTEPEKYLNKKFEFIITKFEEKGRNIVVSRRKVMDLETAENQGRFLDNTKVGDEVEGTVTRMESFGAFVEIAPGVEGLLHISEIGWSRLAHPSEALQIGDKFKMKVIRIEEDAQGRMRLSLSRKQTSEDPFSQHAANFKAGQMVKAKIHKKERFGFLMEIAPGFIGLLPKSAMREGQTEENLDKKNIGDTLELQIINIDTLEKRVSLALANGSEDSSWKEFSSSQNNGFNALGDQLKGLFKK